MELRHLRYFVAVAEEENVSRAALRLHVSQPGLSRQIHDLEEEIGFQLFERTAKSLHLTRAGRTFLPEARGVLQHALDAVNKARAAIGGTHGELHVGYAPTLTLTILPKTLRKFQAKFPHVRVALHDLTTEEMAAQLLSGKIQVALVVPPGRKLMRGLEFKELARFEGRVAVAPRHPLAMLKKVSLERLTHESLIAYDPKDYPEYPTMLKKIFSGQPRLPRIAEVHDSVTSIIAAVESGRGFALVPDNLALMVGTRLKLIPLLESAVGVTVGAVWKQGVTSELVREFIAIAATVK